MARVHYTIESFENGVWGEWYSSPDRGEAERMWKRVQLIEPQVPVRFVEVEVVAIDQVEAVATGR